MSKTRRTIMIWNAARGGMRSVVEAYERDGFLAQEGVTLIAAYADGGFLKRQVVLLKGLLRFLLLAIGGHVELVHIHAAMRGSFWRKGLFASIARAFGIPVLLHLHGSEMKLFYGSLPDWAKKKARRHLERASRVLVLSESWRDFILTIAPRAHIIVVPNYVTVPPLPDASARVPGEVLFLGLVGDRKGVFDLIPAFAQVAGAHPDARLVIGGNGELDRARQAIQAAGADRSIDLAGWIEGAAKEALLARASVYVLPSHNEGLPMSVLEAMARGLPVVTTRVGGIPELITDGVDGLLIDAGDQAALAQRIDALLADEALRTRIAAAGRSRIETHYSDKAILPLLRDIYRDARKKTGS
ncbi:glycosyltransferase family 4 protein [Sphingobium sp. CCH11-B1]|jgi:glycosyltransferase involved in cell wall biosynthesis|uniref:glycosyltransferase family 4 protein n=1 Tax=Sphingobium sp. CCH11-B1 TaxID=1768781 RepID=UPI00082A7F25|nr:glycosyltransferase family 4 protein [Sphingobium sp. CCH11-B1]MEA3389284.1 glycosyltransferase family 4 protein [Pseudomonadota bacterium]